MAEILVVDDVEHIRLAVKNALQGSNHVVSLAENGEEAQEILKKMSFDLVITDILMPHRDGIDLIRFIHENYQDQIPIIAMSGGGNAASYKEVVKVAKNYISIILEKPFSKDRLLDAVEDALDSKSFNAQAGY